MEDGRDGLMANKSRLTNSPGQLTEHEIADLHRRTEYLLDEMEMGSVDYNAFDSDGGRHTTGHTREDMPRATNNLDTLSRNGDHHNSFGYAPEEESRVLPETALPSIRRQPKQEPARPPQERFPQDSARQPQSKPLQPRPARGKPQPVSTYDDFFPSRWRPAAPAAQTTDSATTSSVSMTNARALEEEIAEIYEQVSRLQEKRQSITGHALSLLREAITIIHSQPERIARAEYNIRQVRSILERDRENHRRSIRNTFILLLYQAFWIVICIAGIVAMVRYHQDLVLLLHVVGGEQSLLSLHGLPFLWTLLAGATGGVFGALVSLVPLMREGQVFDRQYVVRYIIQPIMGIVLAVLIYLFSFYLFKSVDSDLTANLLTQASPAVIALVAALWQEGVYGSLYRLTCFFRLSRRR
jgi:hypothetical protein